MTIQEKKDLVQATLLAWEGAWHLETVGYQYLDEASLAYQEAQDLEDTGNYYLDEACIARAEYRALRAECEKHITNAEYETIRKEL